MHIFYVLAFFILFVGGVEGTEPGVNIQVENKRDFNQYVKILLDRHPDLKSLNAALEAAKQTPDQAESLPDPTLRFGLINFPYTPIAFDEEGMTQKQIGISQMFPAPGKRGLRKKVAEDNIEIAAAIIPEKQLELVRQARIFFYKMLYLKKLKKKVEKNKKILKGFHEVALTKYSVGLGIQQDVLKAQVEILKMNDLLRRIEQDIKSTGENLSVLADLPLDHDWTDLTIRELPKISGDVEKLLEEAVEERYLFKQLRAKITRAKDSVELARKNLLPDYTVGLSYGQRESIRGGPGADLVSLSVALKIPWLYKNRHDKKISENIILREKAEYELESEKWKLKRKIANLLETDKTDTDLLVLYNSGLIPQAQQTVEASMASYQVNKVEFLTLVTNQVTLFNNEIKKDQIEFELQSTRTQLMREMGKGLKGEQYVR